MRQLTLDLIPPRGDGFESVVTGANGQVVQRLRHLDSAQPQALPEAAAPVPVYLWGTPGSGKTRLLRAVAHERQVQGEPVAWFGPDSPLPWQIDGRHAVVLLDDVDRLDTGRQHAAFALFIEATSQARQWVAAGALPPVDLPLRDDLRSRLGWGDVYALMPLSDADLAAVLRLEGAARDLRLSDDVIDYMLTHFTRDPNHLMQLLTRLDRFALAHHRALTVPLLKRMLHESTGPDTGGLA